MAILTLAVLVVALPAASCICTVTAGEIDVAETVLDGWVINASFDAAPAVMLNVLDVAGVRPIEAALRV